MSSESNRDPVDRNVKNWSRLRAILSKLTLAGVAASAPVLADAAPAPEPGRDLAAQLSELPAIESMGTAAELALSTDPAERQQLAAALAWSFPLPGDQVVIEHLAHDQEPTVRAAAARAAWARRSPELATRVLHRLLGDDDPEVRAAAWLAVSR